MSAAVRATNRGLARIGPHRGLKQASVPLLH